MKSKNLSSINHNILLGLFAFSTLAFASCSHSLTSLQNSKKMQNQEVLVNPNAAEKHEMQIAVAPQVQNTESAIVPQSKVGLVPTSNFKTDRSATITSKTSVLSSKIAAVKTQILNKVENQVGGVQNLAKNPKIASYNHSRQFGFGMVRRGIALIIIGLILLIIAFLLPWPLSNLFYIIGAIFLVVGIIDLLFGLLRAM